MTVLLVTVGGQHQPIVTAIETIEPEFVVFLCSKDLEGTKGSYEQVIGKGNVLRSALNKEPDLPNIVTLTDLKEDQYEIATMDPDNLEDCYAVIRDKIRRVKERFPRSSIFADYTGGTKTMTAALAMAGSDDSVVQLRVTTGTRGNLEKVSDRTENTIPVSVTRIRAQRILDMVDHRLKVFDYFGAESILREIAANLHTDDPQKLRRAIHFCHGLNEWDKFLYSQAYEILEPYGKFLKEIAVLGHLRSENGAWSYLAVEDLLFNAERRYHQERFDDAVARVYRAIELIAQIRLKKTYGIDTSDVEVEKVVPEARSFVEANLDTQENKIRLGLVAAWDLLTYFPSEELGHWYREKRGKILNFLHHRNSSKLAHGDNPVDKHTYLGPVREIIEMCREAISLVSKTRGRKQYRFEQLPNRLPGELRNVL